MDTNFLFLLSTIQITTKQKYLVLDSLCVMLENKCHFINVVLWLFVEICFKIEFPFLPKLGRGGGVFSHTYYITILWGLNLRLLICKSMLFSIGLDPVDKFEFL